MVSKSYSATVPYIQFLESRISCIYKSFQNIIEFFVYLGKRHISSISKIEDCFFHYFFLRQSILHSWFYIIFIQIVNHFEPLTNLTIQARVGIKFPYIVDIIKPFFFSFVSGNKNPKPRF